MSYRVLLLAIVTACGSHGAAPSPASTVPSSAAAVPSPPPASQSPGPAAPQTGGAQPSTTRKPALNAWPLAPFTTAQVAEAVGCKLDQLASARYPTGTAVDALAGAYARKDACDDATLAAACAERAEENTELPASCVDAYQAAVRANPAFAAVGQLFGGYLGKVALVDPPPLASHAIVSVAIDYAWTGLGKPVQWHLTARDLAGTPRVEATGANAKPVAHAKDVGARAAALGAALGSLVPIREPIHAVACTDNDPDWTVSLAFDDGSRLELVTHGSNALGPGGPWQTTLGGVLYVQLAPDFANAIGELVKLSGQPFGHPRAMYCHGFDLTAAVLGKS